MHQVEASLSAGVVLGEILYHHATVSGGEGAGEDEAVAFFGGIPYAKPPIGPLRWCRPQPPARWRPQVLDCSRGRGERRALAIQPISDDQRADGVQVCEDCLYVYVWAPAGRCALSMASTCPDDRNIGRPHIDAKAPSHGRGGCRSLELGPGKPVLVWIHGGGLTTGGPVSDGEGAVYARQHGIVFCSFCYRLGALGYVWPRGGDANCGLWDQIAALRWVHEEISAFGGDPHNITVSGHSSGGDSIHWLMASPMSAGLFRKAILMSPACRAISAAQAREISDEFVSQLLTQVGYGRASGKEGAEDSELDQLATLRDLSAGDILNTQLACIPRVSHAASPGWRLGDAPCPLMEPPEGPSSVTSAGLLRMRYEGMPQPVAIIDGDLLDMQPLDSLAAGRSHDVDVIIGYSREENGYGSQGGGKVEVREEVLRRLMWELAGTGSLAAAAAAGWDREEVRECARWLVSEYEAELQGSSGNASSQEQWLWDMISTDLGFGSTAQLLTETLAMQGPTRRVWRYSFDGFDGSCAYHTFELELLLCDRDAKYAAVPVQRAWTASWAAFAATGDPSVAGLGCRWMPYAPPSDGPEPLENGSSCTLIIDGRKGFRIEGATVRRGLRATCLLWGRLWGFQPSMSMVPRPAEDDSTLNAPLGPLICGACGSPAQEAANRVAAGESWSHVGRWYCAACWAAYAPKVCGRHDQGRAHDDVVGPWECAECGCHDAEGREQDGWWFCSHCQRPRRDPSDPYEVMMECDAWY